MTEKLNRRELLARNPLDLTHYHRFGAFDDKLVVYEFPKAKETAGGIVLPDGYGLKENSPSGIVIAVGPGKVDTGQCATCRAMYIKTGALVKMSLVPGDIVTWSNTNMGLLVPVRDHNDSEYVDDVEVFEYRVLYERELAAADAYEVLSKEFKAKYAKELEEHAALLVERHKAWEAPESTEFVDCHIDEEGNLAYSTGL